MKCTGGSTGGLLKHIKNVHQKNLATEIIDNQNAELPVPSSSTPSTAEPRQKKKKMTDYYESKSNPSMQVMVSRMTAKDGCPFRLFTESKDMRKLFQSSGHNLPKSATAIRNIVVKEADIKKLHLHDEIQKLLKDNHKFSISFDEWTSLRNRRYISLNLHSKKFSGNNNFKTLGLIRIYGSLPAKKCLEAIRLKLQGFGVSLDTDIVAESTDGCSMMIKFGKLLKSYHQTCIAHALPLAINDVFYKKTVDPDDVQDMEAVSIECDDEDDNLTLAELARKYGTNRTVVDDRSDNESDDETDGLQIEQIDLPPSAYNEQQFELEYQKLLGKMKSVVKLFRKSPTKNDDVLQKYVVVDFKKEYTLTNDCKTRWGSLANTLERFLKLKTCIAKALIDIKSNILFTEDDWTLMEQLYEILDIIRIVLEALCRRDATLLTADVAVTFGLKKLSAVSTNIGKKMFTCLKKRCSKRRLIETSVLKYLQCPDVYFTSAQDDEFPRPDSNEMLQMFVKLLTRTGCGPPGEQIEEEQACQSIDNEMQPEVALSKKKELNAEVQKASESGRFRVRRTQYDLESTIRIEMALLENGGDRGRHLSMAYDYLLTVPPTSVEPERIFSAAGLLCSKIRSRLGDKTLDSLIFLRACYNEENIQL